jgi:hypothetical protein
MARSIRTPCTNLVSSQSYDERRGHDSTQSEERAQRIRDAVEVGPLSRPSLEWPLFALSLERSNDRLWAACCRQRLNYRS